MSGSGQAARRRDARIGRVSLVMVVSLQVLWAMPLGLAAASGPKVELRPMKKITQLQIQQCEVEVAFRLSLSDGGSEDYYCPQVVWEWEDGSFSSEQSDCPPIEEATPSDHGKTWTQSRSFQYSGRYLVRAHLCQGRRRIKTVSTTALVTGWAGYRSDQRAEAGCSPAHERPVPPPRPTPTPGSERIDEGLLMGIPNNDPAQTVTGPKEPREPCDWVDRLRR